MKSPIIFKEYIWLVNTIYKAKKITLEEINQEWMKTEMSGGLPLPRSSFNRHKDAIEDMFGIYIECERVGGYKYYIGNAKVLEEDTIQNWMLSTLSVNNIISECRSIHDRIILEPIPSDGEYLQRVIEAMKENVLICFTYQKYGADTIKEIVVEPYLVKLFPSYDTYHAEAMAMGERTPVALLDYAASARLAVAESITNIAAVDIGDIDRIKVSANWMAAAGHPGEDAGLYAAVKAVGEELCPSLGITIPVGKDSMSMKTKWEQDGQERAVISPLSLIISSFARVEDVRLTKTPQLRVDLGETSLILIDLGLGKNRLGGSALAQVYKQLGKYAPDVENPVQLKGFFDAIQFLNRKNFLIAYHDKSDGGLFTTVAEMAFAGHTGVTINIDGLGVDDLAVLFNEELGALIQVKTEQKEEVLNILSGHGLAHCIHTIGTINNEDRIIFRREGRDIINEPRTYFRTIWAETTYHMQSLRDNPACAKSEYDSKFDSKDPGLNVKLTFDVNEDVAAPYISKGSSPRIAILREQGVNSQGEMAAAFNRAGFECVDVHMSDILSGKLSLKDFQALAACGGFSYGDVLGAGEGWAKSVLFNNRARDEFQSFFTRKDTLSLGICNGCQMMSNLRDIIPGAELWPRFVRNESERFEARFSLVEIQKSASLFFKGMAGSHMPIAVSHGEGRTEYRSAQHLEQIEQSGLIAVRFNIIANLI